MLKRSSDETKTNWNVTILVSFLTLIGSFGGNFLLYKGNSNQTQSAAIQAFMDSQMRVNETQNRKIENLEANLIESMQREETWRQLYINESLENLELRTQISVNTNELEVIKGWMDGMPFEGWAKRKNESGELVLITINERFTATYGLTKTSAIGKTDFELFPEHLAREYVAGDLAVINSGKAKVSTVDYKKPDGTIVKMRHIKWRIDFSDGTYGAAGLVLSNQLFINEARQ